MAGKINKKLTIQNVKGLHARAALTMVKLVENFNSEITVCKDGLCADARSTMDLMMLTAPKGSDIEISADGTDAEKAVDAISDLINAKFNEEE